MPNKPENPMPSEDIFDLRQLLGLSQSKFADLVGVENTTVSRWETARATPNQYHDMVLKNLTKKARKNG